MPEWEFCPAWESIVAWKIPGWIPLTLEEAEAPLREALTHLADVLLDAAEGRA